MQKVSVFYIGVLLATVFLLSGCGETECDECTDCSFEGEYYGTIQSLNETCADVTLLTGEKYIKVISQTPLSFESRDSLGRWGMYTGMLCDTTDEDDPRNYPFNGLYSPDTTGKDYRLDYTLVGFFTAEYQEEETIYPASITATLDVRLVFDDGEICTLTGDVRVARTLGP